MKHPTKRRGCRLPTAVSLAELGTLKCVYLADSRAHRDPPIVWGTAVDARPLTEFVVAESRRCHVLLSPVHVLVSAVARSLEEHPYLNRKVIGRRVYPYNEINIVIPLLTPIDRQIDPVFIRGVANMSLRDIALSVWNKARHYFESPSSESLAAPSVGAAINF